MGESLQELQIEESSVMKDLIMMDCTLRDGANVVGKGFSAELTKMMIEGLIKSNIKVIEFGNALGLGAYESRGAIAPLTDIEYLELVQPYLDQAELGMFIGVANVTEENVALAAKYGLKFLRIGANASDGKSACEAVKLVKKHGLICRYSAMKAYVLNAADLAEEARMLEECGLDELTIMDSAGTMTPGEVREYVEKMVAKVKMPVGFHGHNNLGFSGANAIAAAEAGASVIDCGLMGMARSAGNCPTEMAAALFQRIGQMEYIDQYSLLDFIDKELSPAMKEYGYHNPVEPIDLVFGDAGAHSSFEKIFRDVAAEKNVHLYKLIRGVSKLERKTVTRDIVVRVADEMLRA